MNLYINLNNVGRVSPDYKGRLTMAVGDNVITMDNRHDQRIPVLNVGLERAAYIAIDKIMKELKIDERAFPLFKDKQLEISIKVI
jgi:hypothetical protein